MIPETTFQFSGVFVFYMFASAYSFQDVFLEFESKTQLHWDLGNWSLKIKENLMVCGLFHEDTELTMATYYIFLIILHPSLLFWRKGLTYREQNALYPFFFECCKRILQFNFFSWYTLVKQLKRQCNIWSWIIKMAPRLPAPTQQTVA